MSPPPDHHAAYEAKLVDLTEKLNVHTAHAIEEYNRRVMAEVLWQRKKRDVMRACLDDGQSVAAAEREADHAVLDEWEQFRRADAELSRQLLLVEHFRFRIAHLPAAPVG